MRRSRCAFQPDPIAWRRDNAGALAASAKWCFVCSEVMDGLGVPVHRFMLGSGRKSVSIRRRCRAEVPN